MRPFRLKVRMRPFQGLEVGSITHKGRQSFIVQWFRINYSSLLDFGSTPNEDAILTVCL